MALDYSVIGQRIKQARLAKNLTQEDLAEQIDISVAFLSRVERGNSIKLFRYNFNSSTKTIRFKLKKIYYKHKWNRNYK